MAWHSLPPADHRPSQPLGPRTGRLAGHFNPWVRTNKPRIPAQNRLRWVTQHREVVGPPASFHPEAPEEASVTHLLSQVKALSQIHRIESARRPGPWRLGGEPAGPEPPGRGAVNYLLR